MNIQQIQATYLRARLSDGSTCLCIKGNSMYPHFLDGQKVYVRRAKPTWGSVVIVETGTSSLLAHRVIAILGKKVVTKGDNNLNHDRIINSQDIIGIVETQKHDIRDAVIAFISLQEAVVNMMLYALIKKRWVSLHVLLILVYSLFERKKWRRILLQNLKCLVTDNNAYGRKDSNKNE